MKNLFPYRPDLVKLGAGLRKFSMSFGVTGIIVDHVETSPAFFWISIALFFIGGIGELITTLYGQNN